jgi:hypothetical protein
MLPAAKTRARSFWYGPLSIPAWAWAAAIAGCLLSGRSLSGGLLLDDLWHRLALTGTLPAFRRPPWALYDFVGRSPQISADLVRLGSVTWWAPPDLRVRFLRPLPSLLLTGEAALFGERIWPCHLHSLLWFGALVLVAARVFRRVLPSGSAPWATLLYAVASVHVEPAGWLSARHALMTALFGLLCLDSHVRLRQENWEPGRWWSLGWLALGLASGESAVATLGYVMAYEALEASDPWPRRLRAAAPLSLLIMGYAGLHAALGYGAHGSGLYAGSVGAYMRNLGWRLPALWMELVLALPAELSAASPTTQRMVGLSGLAAATLFALIAWAAWARLRRESRRTWRWLTVGALLAALPGAAGETSGRVLTLSAFGIAGALATVALAWRELGPRRSLARVGVVVLLFPALLVGPVMRLLRAEDMHDLAQQTWEVALDPQLDRICPDASDGLLVAAADPAVVAFAPSARFMARGLHPFRSFHVVSMAPQDHRLTDVVTNGFDLHVVGPRGHNLWEFLQREAPWHAGEIDSTPLMTVQVVDTVSTGPVHLRVRLQRPLDAPDLCLLQWQDGHLRRLPPLHPGDTLNLPHEPGPMGL